MNSGETVCFPRSLFLLSHLLYLWSCTGFPSPRVIFSLFTRRQAEVEKGEILMGFSSLHIYCQRGHAHTTIIVSSLLNNNKKRRKSVFLNVILLREQKSLTFTRHTWKNSTNERYTIRSFVYFLFLCSIYFFRIKCTFYKRRTVYTCAKDEVLIL